jgi:hypothetical protein
MAGMFLSSLVLLYYSASKISSSQDRRRGGEASPPSGCPTVKSCEEQRQEKCGGVARGSASASPSGRASGGSGGKVLVLSTGSKVISPQDTMKVNIFVRSCRTAVSRRGDMADVVFLSDDKAANDLLDIFQIVGVTEVVYQQPLGKGGASARWTVIR